MVELVTPRHVAGMRGGRACELSTCLQPRQTVGSAKTIDVVSRNRACRHHRGGKTKVNRVAIEHGWILPCTLILFDYCFVFKVGRKLHRGLRFTRTPRASPLVNSMPAFS